MLRGIRVLALVVAAAVAVPATARAQASAPDHMTVSAGPRRELTATAVRAPATASDRDAALAAATRRQGLGQPMALMIVGGAALLAGVVIGGDAGTLIALGGVVVGLIGLYQYLQ
jgi:hypothetical protein